MILGVAIKASVNNLVPSASVAQWIEHRIPVPGARVRLLSDAFIKPVRYEQAFFGKRKK